MKNKRVRFGFVDPEFHENLIVITCAVRVPRRMFVDRRLDAVYQDVPNGGLVVREGHVRQQKVQGNLAAAVVFDEHAIRVQGHKITWHGGC
jgi:hypothetical protein